jgi:uncharacterized protein
MAADRSSAALRPAIGEELLFRGFIMKRLGDAIGASRLAPLAAAAGRAAPFAAGHAYLGPRGALNAGALGLTAGLAYRCNGRNLWPLFICARPGRQRRHHRAVPGRGSRRLKP